MSTNHVTESLPAYALGILEEPERLAVRDHLAQCADCRAELSSYQAVVEQLPHTVPQRMPPAHLRTEILRHTSPGRATRPAWLAWLWRPIPPLAALIGLAVILILGAANLALWQQVQQSRAELAVSTPARFRLVALNANSSASSPQISQATGLLVISGDGRYGTLVVDGLAQLDPNRQYQFWLVKNGQRTNGGVFSVQESGSATLRIDAPLPLSEYQSFGITIEPFGGSPGPTGETVLGGGL